MFFVGLVTEEIHRAVRYANSQKLCKQSKKNKKCKATDFFIYSISLPPNEWGQLQVKAENYL